MSAPLSTFWRAAVDVDPGTLTESAVAGAAEGDGRRVGRDRRRALTPAVRSQHGRRRRWRAP